VRPAADDNRFRLRQGGWETRNRPITVDAINNIENSWRTEGKRRKEKAPTANRTGTASILAQIAAT